MVRTCIKSFTVMAALVVTAAPAAAALIGESSLIDTLHYADSFTIPGPNNRNNTTVHISGDDPANAVEQTFGNPAQQWQPTKSFAYRDITTSFGGLGDGAGNTGNLTGYWETGGSDVAHGYGLSDDYIIQVDAVLPADRLDIGSYATPGGIFSSNSLTVFFRRDGGRYPAIGLYNGSVETDTGFTTGISLEQIPVVNTFVDSDWHNFAVRFNRIADELSFYVDETLVGTLDLTTFAGGIYQNYSNDFVGFGGSFVTEVDNYQVGLAVPEPTSLALLVAGSFLILKRRVG